ncbi:MAG TPA: hypothetical protein VIT21_00635 [Chthoniobacterales bacterium]
MTRNRRKHENSVRVAAVIWWVLVFSGLGGLGLSYVYIKNQTIACGEERRKLERELRDFSDRSNTLQQQITAESSRLTLDRKLASGYIQMIEIDPIRIVRLDGSNPVVAEQNSAHEPPQIYARQ